MKIIKILLLILILFLGSGCIIIPLFSEDTPSMEVFEEQLKQLTVGSTTREEVISIMGEPHVELKRSILYKYRVISATGRILWGYMLPFFAYACCDGGISRTPGKWMDVSFEFDEHGILTEYRFNESGPDSGYVPSKCISNCYSEQSICKGNSPNNDQDYQCAEKVQRCLNQCN